MFTAHAHSTHIIERLSELDGDVHMVDPRRRHPHVATTEVIDITCWVGEAVEATHSASDDWIVHGVLGARASVTSEWVGWRTATL